MKKKLPKYLLEIIKKYPLILSGRKNFSEHHIRIIKTEKLISKYKAKNN